MTKDEALKLALEALKHMCHHTKAKVGYKGKIVEAAMSAAEEALAQPEQEPVTWRYKIVDVFGRPAWTLKTPKSDTRVLESQPLYTTPPQQEAKDEPVAWKWHQAPVKTSWGDGMVVADLAIDKDHTASIYCERDQTAKFEAMSTPPQRKPLTDEEVLRLLSKIDECAVRLPRGLREFARAIEAAHGIKGEA